MLVHEERHNYENLTMSENNSFSVALKFFFLLLYPGEFKVLQMFKCLINR